MKNRATAMVSPEQWGACNPLSWTMLEDAGVKLIRNDKKRLLVKAFQRRFRQGLVNGISDQECLILSKNLIKS